MSLKKLCRCGRLINYSEKYCNQCVNKANETTKAYDKRVRKSDTNKKYDRFYHSKEWSVLRQAAIARDNGLCQDCLKDNKITVYHTVHHIVPIKIDFNKRLNIDNLVCLCESCHQCRHKSMEG